MDLGAGCFLGRDPRSRNEKTQSETGKEEKPTKPCFFELAVVGNAGFTPAELSELSS